MQNDKLKFKNEFKKRLNESKLWFGLLRDSDRVKSEAVNWFLDELDEIAKIFGSSILTLKGRR